MFEILNVDIYPLSAITFLTEHNSYAQANVANMNEGNTLWKAAN